MPTLTFQFPKHTAYTAEELTRYGAEDLIVLWEDNDFNTEELGRCYRQNYNNSEDFYQAYILAKMPLDTNDGLIQEALMRLHREEVARERKLRELVTAA